AQKLAEERLAALPAEIRDDVRLALQTPPAKRNDVQKYLAGKFHLFVYPGNPALEQALAARFAKEYAQAKEIDQVIAQLQAKRITFPEIRALYDLPGEVPTRILRRGEYTNPGAEVKPGVLAMLTTPKPFAWTPPDRTAKTSARRLAFAKWLTQPEHP